jgi:hypothetical protein
MGAQIWPIRLSKAIGIVCYFADFANEVSVKYGLKLVCQNLQLLLGKLLGRSIKVRPERTYLTEG